MSKDFEYLSEKELNKLMEAIESGQDEMASAPEDFEAQVLDFITEQEKLMQRRNSKQVQITGALADQKTPDNTGDTYRLNATSRKNKKVDFGIYCVKVLVSVAAAIFILVVLPQAGGGSLPGGESVPSREEVVATTNVITKEEALSGEKTRSREEVLNENNDQGGLLPKLQMIFDHTREG